MEELLIKISKLKVLVIGDVMLDHYIWGSVDRISPEAPVPVVHVKKDTYVAGGAANVALNIVSLGGHCGLSGWIGMDHAADRLCHILDRSNVTREYLFQKETVSTILKTRVIARQQQVCRLDHEELPSKYMLESKTLLEQLQHTVEALDAIILSDYAKGVINDTLVQDIIQLAHANNCTVSMDPKPSRKINFKGIDILTPNKSESYKLANIDPSPEDGFPAEAVCKSIWEQYQPRFLVITLGADGILISEKGKVVTTIPTYAQEVYDVSGAGDTVIASLTLAVAAGANIIEAAQLANTAAGIVVSKIGTATARPHEIIEFQRIHNE